MGKKFLILFFIISSHAIVYGQVHPLDSTILQDTAIILPHLDLLMDSIGPETPSSVPQANDQLSARRQYRQVIKPNAITRRGLFSVHKVDDDYYFEIPDSLLDRNLLVVSRIARGAAGVRPGTLGFAGDQIGTTVIRFEKGPNHNIFLRRISFDDNPGDSTNSMFKGIIRSNLQSLAASFSISAYTPLRDGSVIEVTDYLNGDNDILFFTPGTKKQMKIGSMLNNMCYIKDVRPFPVNVEIRTIKTYDQSTNEGSSFTWELNTSILLLPKTPMKKRFADKRVGYFTERYNEYNTSSHGVEVVNYIKRWRLEPRPEDLEKYMRGELVEPKQPILFYIDPDMPKKWVPYLIQGVQDWQVAFTRAGFKNAIIAKEAPVDEDWSLEDARNSVIVYKPSSVANASGPIITDPRSGEILESHINWFHNITSLLRTWYMIQCGAVDTGAQKMNFDDELMGRLIRSVACHEVGHSLGLVHNYGASSSTLVEAIRSKEFVQKYGFCSSIMDYARFNYVAQPEDSINRDGLISRIGAYDIWAIEWGYRYFPEFKSSDEEKMRLNAWTSTKGNDKKLWFGSEFATQDPRAQTEDLGNDAMRAGNYGIKNLQRIVPNLIKWTMREGAGYAGLSEIYNGVTNQYSNYIDHVLRYVGGTYETMKTTEQPGPVYQSVPASKQREAMQFLDRNVFQTPHWLLDTAILSRIGIPPSQVVERAQADALSTLLDKNTLDELVDAESMLGTETYTLKNFFDDLNRSVWSELDSREPFIDQYRRTLQRYYTRRLLNLAGSPTASQGYNDIQPMVRSQLKDLRNRIKVALKKTDDTMTKTHLQFLYDEISGALPSES